MSSMFRTTAIATLLLGASCLAPSSKLERRAEAPTYLDAARVQASESAPALPIFVLRIARDELALSTDDRAGVAMIVQEAEYQARTLDRARAAYLEILARSVDRGSVDENAVAIFTEQMVWASGLVGPYFAYGLTQLYDVLTPDQRTALVGLAAQRYPLWAGSWAADLTRPRWLEGFARRDLSDLVPNLVQTSRAWAARSAAHVRTELPRLDPMQRAALSRSLRLGRAE